MGARCTPRTTHFVAGGLGILLAMAVAACGGSDTDKAGGRVRAAPVVLTFATVQPFLPVQLAAFPTEVERLSGGALRIGSVPVGGTVSPIKRWASSGICGGARSTWVGSGHGPSTPLG